MPTIGVAVAIPEPWATELQDYRTSVGDAMAATIPTHITLVPPTEVDRRRAREIEAHLEDAAADVPAFEVHLRGTGTFRPVSPVVFVTLVEGISQCEQLAGAVRRGPLAVDLAFPYHPHVTVAHDLAEARLDQAFDELADFECEFDVDGLPPLRPRRRARLDAHALLRARARVPDRACPPSSTGSRAASPSCGSERPALDHVVRMQEHYGETKASQQAGAVTYFGFLSVFPVLALAFFVVGYVAKVYPDAQDNLRQRDRVDVPGADRHRPEPAQHPGHPGLGRHRRGASASSASSTPASAGSRRCATP